MDSLGNDIPTNISKIKHQVLRFIIDWPLEDLGPVFEIRPRLIGCASGKGRESSKELEENTPERPIVDSERVWLPT